MSINLDNLFGGGLALPSSGLLSDEDRKALGNQSLMSAGAAIASGQQGLFPALAQGLKAGQDTYQGGVKNAIGGQEAQQSLYASAMKNAQQQKLMQSRQELFQKYPMPDASDPTRLREWIDTVTPYLIQNNDLEVLGHLGEVRKSLEPKKPNELSQVKNVRGADGKLYTIMTDPFSGKEVGRYEQGKDPNAVTADNAAERTNISLDNAYLSDTKDLKSKGLLIDEAKTALASVKTGNSAARGSAFSKYVQAVDQDKNLRMQMLLYYENNIDASVKGSLSKFEAKMATGTIPPYIIKMMEDHLNDMNTVYVKNLQSRHDDWQGRYPNHKFPAVGAYVPANAPATPTPPGAPPLSSFQFGMPTGQR